MEWDEGSIDISPDVDVRPRLKRRRITFVPQSSTSSTSTIINDQEKAKLPESHDLYLAIVGRPGDKTPSWRDSSESELHDTEAKTTPADTDLYCDICQLPKVSTSKLMFHESSFVHQLCLDHSHPPSSLDRRRKGFSYLQAQGWDPDTRTGLGALGEGRLYPVQPTKKEGQEGLGSVAATPNFPKVERRKQVRPLTLDAMAMRKVAVEEKKRSDTLQRLFTGNDEVNKYLGIDL